jgi:Uma2 family endonuclease
MNEHASQLMTVTEFIGWAAAQAGGRYELDRGRVITLSPERVGHLKQKGLVYLALLQAIQRSGRFDCHALPDGATVRIDEHTAFEPDALVYIGPEASDETVIIPTPIIVVEVLSPSTAAREVGRKLIRYFTVPSIKHYLILDPDERTLVHHRRAANGDIATRVIGQTALSLDPPGLTVALLDLWNPVPPK